MMIPFLSLRWRIKQVKSFAIRCQAEIAVDDPLTLSADMDHSHDYQNA